jgi:hypothetical protein
MASPAKGLSDEEAARMMAALREGRTRRNLGVKPARLEAYFEAHPEYACEALPLVEANAKAAQLRKGATKRALTHCKYGHPLSGDNLYLAPGRKERKCWACIKRRDRAPQPPSAEQVQQATAALKAGKTINEICWGKVDGQKVGKAILTFRKLRLYRQLNPDFERFVVAAMADHNSKGQRRRFDQEKARAKIANEKPRRPKTWVRGKMSDDKASRILPGLRAGLTLRQLGVTPRRFNDYCDAHPDYAREARPLQAVNADRKMTPIGVMVTPLAR